MIQQNQDKLLKDKIPFSISCDQAAFLVSKSQHTRLTLIERIKLIVHLAICPHCRRYQKQIKFLDKIILRLKSAPDLKKYPHKLSKEQKEKLAKALNNGDYNA